MNFALLRGQIGRRGAGVCPVRGHSNVQGDRTVGIWEKMSPEFLEALGKEFDFSPPEKHGFDTVRTIEAMHQGTGESLRRPGRQLPGGDARHAITPPKRLQRCQLDGADLDQAQPRPSDHGRAGADSPLPGPHGNRLAEVRAAVRQRRRHDRRRAHVAGRAGAGLASICEASRRSSPASPAPRSQDKTTVDWEGLIDNYDRIREHIEHVVPGFTQYNARVRQPGGFYLPNAPHQGKFNTPSKRAQLHRPPDPRASAARTASCC